MKMDSVAAISTEYRRQYLFLHFGPEQLSKPLYELAAEVYKNAEGANASPGAAGPQGFSAGAEGQDSAKGEKVVDAEYKVVDDDKK